MEKNEKKTCACGEKKCAKPEAKGGCGCGDGCQCGPSCACGSTEARRG